MARGDAGPTDFALISGREKVRLDRRLQDGPPQQLPRGKRIALDPETVCILDRSR